MAKYATNANAAMWSLNLVQVAGPLCLWQCCLRTWEIEANGDCRRSDWSVGGIAALWLASVWSIFPSLLIVRVMLNATSVVMHFQMLWLWWSTRRHWWQLFSRGRQCLVDQLSLETVSLNVNCSIVLFSVYCLLFNSFCYFVHCKLHTSCYCSVM